MDLQTPGWTRSSRSVGVVARHLRTAVLALTMHHGDGSVLAVLSVSYTWI
jgi:hypothetical protein